MLCTVLDFFTQAATASGAVSLTPTNTNNSKSVTEAVGGDRWMQSFFTSRLLNNNGTNINAESIENKHQGQWHSNNNTQHSNKNNNGNAGSGGGGGGSTVSVSGTCGGGNRGNGVCPVAGKCCSQFGYCGTSAEHCPGISGSNMGGGNHQGQGHNNNNTQHSNKNNNGNAGSGGGGGGSTVSVSGTCGGGNRGNGVCPVAGKCCSQFGYCGTSAEHCPGISGSNMGGGNHQGQGHNNNNTQHSNKNNNGNAGSNTGGGGNHQGQGHTNNSTQHSNKNNMGGGGNHQGQGHNNNSTQHSNKNNMGGGGNHQGQGHNNNNDQHSNKNKNSHSGSDAGGKTNNGDAGPGGQTSSRIEIPMKQGDVAMVEVASSSTSTFFAGFFFLGSLSGFVVGYFVFKWRMSVNKHEVGQSLDMPSSGSHPSPPWDHNGKDAENDLNTTHETSEMNASIVSDEDLMNSYESAMSLDIEPEDPDVERAISIGLGLGHMYEDEEHPQPQII